MSKLREYEKTLDRIKFLDGNIQLLNDAKKINGIGLHTDTVQVWLYSEQLPDVKESIIYSMTQESEGLKLNISVLEQEALIESQQKEQQAIIQNAETKQKEEDAQLAEMVQKKLLELKAEEIAKQIIASETGETEVKTVDAK
jgi:hypothetical protein